MIGNLEYNEFISRNYLYISDEIQNKIKNIRLVFFGTGLSSLIAEHCARLGFMHIHLHDGDKVELSNLNRQAFDHKDIGVAKAIIVMKKLLQINPECNVTNNTGYINHEIDYEELIDNSDVVINTIDCNKTYFDIIEYTRNRNKLVICPFNPGFSGMAISFNQHSCRSDELFNLEEHTKLNDLEIAKQIFEKYPDITTLKQLGIDVTQFIETIVKKGYFPQITIGALLTSAITLTIIINYLKNEPINLAPKISYLNFEV